MRRFTHPYIYLPAAGGGGDQDLDALVAGLDHAFRVETVLYPGWRRYVADDFSAEALLSELTAEVVKRVPTGPIGIIGISIGGHFGYAIALRLEAMGREVDLLCAIDSFMVTSSDPSAGWQSRAILDALDMLRRGSFGELSGFVRSKIWRVMIRLLEGRLTGVLRRFSGGELPSFFRHDKLAERELSMRLMLRKVAPWVGELDRNVVELNAPTILIRTEASVLHDAAWQRRCPEILIREVAGRHEALFDPDTMCGIAQAFVSATNQLAMPSFQ